jgi:hypothetical protein
MKPLQAAFCEAAFLVGPWETNRQDAKSAKTSKIQKITIREWVLL